MKNKLKYIVTLAGLLAGMTGLLQAQTPLKIYQDTAAANNPGILSLFRQYESVMQKAPQNRILPDPQLGFGYFINSVETRVGPQRAVLSLSQSFPWFGQLGAQEQAVIERAKSVLERFNNERAKLNFNVAATYNSLYVLRSAVRITEENIRLLQTLKDLANVRFESGKASMVDVLRIEMELGELVNQLKFLEDSERPLVAEFEQLLNVRLTDGILLPDTLWNEQILVTREQIMDSVKILNPSILSIEHEILSYDQDVLAARKTGGPSFTVGLNYTIVSKLDGYTGEGNGKDAILPTIGVKIPLYRKKYQSLVLEKQIARESAVLKKDDRTNELRTLLEKTFRDYDDGVRRVALYEQLQRYARQALDILIAEYTSTATNFEEIIRMDRKLLKYELELEKARADQNTAYAYIEYLMGK